MNTKDQILHFLKALGGGAMAASATLAATQAGFFAHVLGMLPNLKPWMVYLTFLGVVLHGVGTSAQSLASLIAEYFGAEGQQGGK